jgi:hypothetical protein
MTAQERGTNRIHIFDDLCRCAGIGVPEKSFIARFGFTQEDGRQ